MFLGWGLYSTLQRKGKISSVLVSLTYRERFLPDPGLVDWSDPGWKNKILQAGTREVVKYQQEHQLVSTKCSPLAMADVLASEESRNSPLQKPIKLSWGEKKSFLAPEDGHSAKALKPMASATLQKNYLYTLTWGWPLILLSLPSLYPVQAWSTSKFSVSATLLGRLFQTVMLWQLEIFF